MQVTAGQTLVFFLMLWLAILLWPKFGRFVARVLGIHAHALAGLYDFIGKGLREYNRRAGEPVIMSIDTPRVPSKDSLRVPDEAPARHLERMGLL